MTDHPRTATTAGARLKSLVDLADRDLGTQTGTELELASDFPRVFAVLETLDDDAASALLLVAVGALTVQRRRLKRALDLLEGAPGPAPAGVRDALLGRP